MRIAIFSDVHACLPALERVLEDATRRKVDRCICVGDMVGYGPHPEAVMDRLVAAKVEMLLGNHEAALNGQMDVSLFREAAAYLITWTRDNLPKAHLKEIRDLPYIIHGERDWVCVHCDMEDPEAFHYLEEEGEARRTWDVCMEQIVFVGHTHVPRIHELQVNGSYQLHLPHPLRMKPSSRYIVNLGSVGMSRDGDPRAAYVIFDDVEKTLQWYRVPFDLPGTAVDAQQAHGPFSQLAYMMPQWEAMGDDREILVEMDEIPDFEADTVSVVIKDSSVSKPAAQPSARASAKASSAESKRSLTPLLAALGLLLLGLLAAGLFFLFHSPDPKDPEPDPTAAQEDAPLLPEPSFGSSRDGLRLDFENGSLGSLSAGRGWRVQATAEKARFGSQSLSLRPTPVTGTAGGLRLHAAFDQRSGHDVPLSGDLQKVRIAGDAAWVAGRFGSGLHFTGGNQIALPKNQAVVAAGQPMTLAAWVYPQGGGFVSILSTLGAKSDGGY